jgi:hypothetical protein
MSQATRSNSASATRLRRISRGCDRSGGYRADAAATSLPSRRPLKSRSETQDEKDPDSVLLWTNVRRGSLSTDPPRQELHVGDLVKGNLRLGRHQLQHAARELVQCCSAK